jgi:C-terminal processing protease CtpA/Prc
MSRADDAAVDEVIKFIKTHAGAPGFVVDLRGADGGSELVARRIARQFCAKQRIYARSKYRGGADPGDFGPTYDRTLDASDTPYTKPVVCVLGPGCVSSGEAFAMMMQCLPNVTTVGRASRGSSGNPRPCTLPGVPVTVLFSRWVDMLPDGRPIEGRGIAPSVAVELSEEEYEKADPTWQKALVVLRDKVEEATDSKKVTP